MGIRRMTRGAPLHRSGPRYSPVGIILALLAAVVVAMLLSRLL